jgi:hypothetical protein
MAMDAYLERIKRARKFAEGLIDRSVSSSALISAKTASAISDGYSTAANKIKGTVEGDDAKAFVGKVKGIGQISSRLLANAKSEVMGHLLKSDATPKLETKQSDLERDTHHAIDKLSSKDKVGVAGDHLAAIGGAAGGFAVAGTVAGAAGATTLLGSGALGSALGGIFVTTTPVGWVIGSAALMGAAGYGIAKMIRSGSAQDQVRKEIIQRLRQRLEVLNAEKITPDCKTELNQLIALTLQASAITEEAACRLVALVEAGTLKPELALERIKSIAVASKLISVS